MVSSVRIVESSTGIYAGEGEYFGGYEGSSLFSWHRETNDGTVNLINGAESRTYEVTDDDYNCRLLFGLVFYKSFLFFRYAIGSLLPTVFKVRATEKSRD